MRRKSTAGKSLLEAAVVLALVGVIGGVASPVLSVVLLARASQPDTSLRQEAWLVMNRLTNRPAGRYLVFVPDESEVGHPPVLVSFEGRHAVRPSGGALVLFQVSGKGKLLECDNATDKSLLLSSHVERLVVLYQPPVNGGSPFIGLRLILADAFGERVTLSDSIKLEGRHSFPVS
jgi:hypothetical protein